MNQDNRGRPAAATKISGLGKPGYGAVAVLAEEGKFLVIKRSPYVRAPNLVCFAGGTIEPQETPEQAIERELLEELNLQAVARERLWRSRTRWGTLLEWVLVERLSQADPIANPDEVSEWMWLPPPELLIRPDLLPSVPDFFVAWAAGAIRLPPAAGSADPAWLQLRSR